MLCRLARILLWPLRVFRRRPVISLAILVLITASATVAAAHIWGLYQFDQARRAMDDDRLPDARKAISYCLTVWPWSVPTHLLAARIDRLGGEYIEAANELAECRRLQNGATEDVQLEMLLLRAQAGDVDQVEGGLLYAVNHDKANEREILEALARGHMSLMHLLPALSLVDRCLKDYPDDVRALDWHGWLMERLDQQDSAAKDYEKVLQLAPGRTEVRLRLAFLYLSHNDPVLAEPLLTRLAKDQPGRLEVQLGLAQCRFLQGKEKEARALLDEVLAAHPDDPTALLYLGKLDLESGQPEEAEVLFRRVLKQDPNSAEALNSLHDSLRGQPGREAEAAEALKKRDEASAFAQRMQHLLSGEVDRSSKDPGPAYELGKMNLDLGRDDVALYWFNTALQRDPDHQPTHALLADYFEKKGDKENAARHRRAERK